MCLLQILEVVGACCVCYVEACCACYKYWRWLGHAVFAMSRPAVLATNLGGGWGMLCLLC